MFETETEREDEGGVGHFSHAEHIALVPSAGTPGHAPEEKKHRVKRFLLHVCDKIKRAVRENFIFATFNFIFIIFFIYLFQMLFGMKNSVIAIIITILMGISAGKDVAAAPVKSFFKEFFVFGAMTVAACFSVYLGPYLSIPVNLVVIFVILYAFTYEYSNSLYFPYILAYLFLVYISPVTPDKLPLRLLSVAVGAVVMVLYALTLRLRNIVRPASAALDGLLSCAATCAGAMKAGREFPAVFQSVRTLIVKLSRNVDARRKGLFKIGSDALAALDAGRGLENLILLMEECKSGETDFPDSMWDYISEALGGFSAFLNKKGELPKIEDEPFGTEDTAREFKGTLLFIADNLTAMRSKTGLSRPKPPAPAAIKARQETAAAADSALTRANTLKGLGQTAPFEQSLPSCRRGLPSSPAANPKDGERKKGAGDGVSLRLRLKILLGYSPVRLVYAVRTALLLTLFMIPVAALSLAHGKWLLFTLASVSLPYADDVPLKAFKRFTATVIGGIVAVLCFSWIGNAAVRTAIMMLAGYLSFYFKDYTGNYACATVGALGGAVFTNAFGFAGVAAMFGIRLGYISLGIVIALVANLLIAPFHRRRANENVYKKYELTASALSGMTDEQLDRRLYYELVIKNNLLEERLIKNAPAMERQEVELLIKRRREDIRKANRADS